MQIISDRGGTQPKVEQQVKTGHICLTATAMAEGPMLPLLWTYAGKQSLRNMQEGCTRSLWNKTEDGWPDETTWAMWAHMLIAEKKKRGLAKMLIFVDNHAAHTDPVVTSMLAKENILLFGLLPACTGRQQPLDLKFFGPLKQCYRKLAVEMGEALTDFSVARLVEAAVQKMEKKAADKGGPGGCSILAPGFRDAGLVPFNPGIFTEESFAASDALLGLHKAHPAVEKAKKTGEAMSKVVVEQALLATKPGLAGALGKLAAAQQEERKARLGAAYVDVSVQAEVAKTFYSSELWAQQQLDAQETKDKEEAEKKARIEERKVRAEANKAAEAAKSAAFKIKRAEGAKRKAEKEALRIQKQQLKADAAKAPKAVAAKPAAAAKAPQGKKRAAAGQPERAAPPAGKKAKRAL
jgi:hypothetical protein